MLFNSLVRACLLCIVGSCRNVRSSLRCCIALTVYANSIDGSIAARAGTSDEFSSALGCGGGVVCCGGAFFLVPADSCCFCALLFTV